jgi:hypothetical protein
VPQILLTWHANPNGLKHKILKQKCPAISILTGVSLAVNKDIRYTAEVVELADTPS